MKIIIIILIMYLNWLFSIPFRLKLLSILLILSYLIIENKLLFLRIYL